MATWDASSQVCPIIDDSKAKKCQAAALAEVGVALQNLRSILPLDSWRARLDSQSNHVFNQNHSCSKFNQ